MQRTVLSAASCSCSSSSSCSTLRVYPFMAKLQSMTFHNVSGFQLSYPLLGASGTYVNSRQIKLRKLRLGSTITLGTGQGFALLKSLDAFSNSPCTLGSCIRRGPLNYAKMRNILHSGSFGSSFRSFSADYTLFPKRCFSNVGNKNNSLGGGDGKGGGSGVPAKGFRRHWKRPKALVNQSKNRANDPSVSVSKDVETVTCNENSSGEGSYVEQPVAVQTANMSKQVPAAGAKKKPRARRKKSKKQSTSTLSTELAVEKDSKAVSQEKVSGIGKSLQNLKQPSKELTVGTSTTLEVHDNSAMSKNKSNGKGARSATLRKTKKTANGSLSEQKPENAKGIQHQRQNTLKPLYPPNGKSVVVVESVTKAKVIQGYLGDMYEVLPSYGHIRDLAARSGSVRPDDDFSMVWEVPSSAWTHLKSIKMALSGAENVILASDPDREGEAIAWHIIEMLHQQDALQESMTVARVVFHEITESAIKSALQAPREIDSNLVHAYLARRALDYLIGFNISPLLWRKLPGCQSAGRVQSAALSLICDREMEIDEFKPREYWSVAVKLNTKETSLSFPAHLSHFNSEKLSQYTIGTQTEAQNIKENISSESLQVIGSKRSTTRKNPPSPYITSTLQQDAANKLHFSTSYTMKLAQKLYEGVQLSNAKATGLITYMRTDGLHISDEAVKDIRSLVVERYGHNFTLESPRKYFKKVKNAQEAHEAIRPTDVRRLPSTLVGILDEDSLKLYTLIWARAVACQMESAKIGQIQVDIGNNGESIVFRSSCSKVEFPGYQAVYEDVEAKAVKHKDDEGSDRDELFGILHSLKAGDTLDAAEVELKQHHTQPPPRYSEGSLVKKLEELGIGRPSTYASTLKVLQDRNYVAAKNRVLCPEFRGRMVSAFLSHYFTEVTDYSFTADMETELDNVSAGLTEWKGLLRDYWTRFSSYCGRVENVHIHQVEKMLEKKYGDFLFANLPGRSRTCPSCMQGTLIFKVSRFGSGYFIGCDQHPRCKYIARTLYGENEEEDGPPKSANMEEPKVLGVHPTSNEKILLKSGPYGSYVQLGENRMGYLPKRASVTHLKDVHSITLEDALDLLRYPLTLGNHPDDGQPVTLKLGKFGFAIRHRRNMASVPKNVNPKDVTMEKALKYLSGKDVRRSGRPKKVKKQTDEEEEEAVEAM